MMKTKITKKELIKLITAAIFIVIISVIVIRYPTEITKLLLDSARSTLPSPISPMLWKYIQ